MTGTDRSRTEVRPLAGIGGHGVDVRVRHVDTPKGERLELDADRGRIRLDAVALECLAYQDERRFEAFFEPPDGGRDAPTVVDAPDDAEPATDLTSITNEFAHVDVRTATTPDGDLLELAAPKAGLSVYLTAPALERIAAQPQAAITELVRRRVE